MPIHYSYRRVDSRPALAISFLLVSVLVATPALAGILESATLRIRIKDLPDAVFVGSGVSGEATSWTSISIDAGSGIKGAVTPAPLAPHLHIFGNSSGFFSGSTPSAIHGDMSFGGDWQPIGGVQTVLYPPLQFGLTATTNLSSGATVFGFEWTVGAASLGTASLTTSPTPITLSGFNGLTAQVGGTLVMVTPMVLSSSMPCCLPPTKAIGELTLVFVPEPGRATGLLAGGLLLAAMGWHRGCSRDGHTLLTTRSE